MGVVDAAEVVVDVAGATLRFREVREVQEVGARCRRCFGYVHTGYFLKTGVSG